MRRKQGFTLVELLVVMAIIAILAAIAIPNVQQWILRSRAVQAVSEIQNMELAITKLLSDAGRSNLTDLYNMEAISLDFGDYDTWTDEDFEDITVILTNATTALLRVGRAAMASPDNYVSTNLDGDGNAVELMRESVIRTLGTSYMSELGADPWGNLYQIFPGTWPARYGLPVFRVYLPPAEDAKRLPGDPIGGVTEDDLTLVDGVGGVTLIDPQTGEPIEAIGMPANTLQSVYIWSNGANLVSGQAKYVPTPDPANPGDGQYTASSLTNYEAGQEPELMGGGDDINNWDRNQTFMVFYN